MDARNIFTVTRNWIPFVFLYLITDHLNTLYIVCSPDSHAVQIHIKVTTVLVFPQNSQGNFIRSSSYFWDTTLSHKQSSLPALIWLCVYCFNFPDLSLGGLSLHACYNYKEAVVPCERPVMIYNILASCWWVMFLCRYEEQQGLSLMDCWCNYI